MKVIQNHNTQERTEQVQKIQHILGRIRKPKGQNLYGMDPETREVYQVRLGRTAVLESGYNKVIDVKNSYRAHIETGHYFVFAINRKNAIRKLNKQHPA